MRGGTVPEAVWPDVWRVRHAYRTLMDHSANDARIDAATTRTKEQSSTAAFANEHRPPPPEPDVERSRGRVPVRDAAFLSSFAQHANEASSGIDVVDVEPDQFAHADTAG